MNSDDSIRRPDGTRTDVASLVQKFDGINLHGSNDNPKLYKPLLLLMALGKLSHGKERISFDEVNTQLPELVKKFQSPHLNPKPSHPFWRLKNDGIWQVDHENLIGQTHAGDALISDLREQNAVGGFSNDVLKILQSNPWNITFLAQSILDKYFSSRFHSEIRDAIGIAPIREKIESEQFERDPRFRQHVLQAYEHQCCVCGYDIRLGGELTGIEAAHIQAVYANGPDEVKNGLSLCVMHHAAFDRGAFTIQDDGRTIQCAQKLSGTSRLEWLTDFNGERITEPSNIDNRPGEDHLAWHRANIFHT